MLTNFQAMALFQLLGMILLVTLVKHASGNRNGAPESACNSMTPLHPGSAQSSPSPYTVTFSPSTFTPGGQPVTVTLSTSGTAFKGFLVTTGALNNDATKLGNFSGANIHLRCSDQAATHTNNDPKTSVSVEWTPPATSQDHVRFRATFVQEYSTYWVNQQSASLLLDSTLPTPAVTQAPATTPAPQTTTTPSPTGTLTKDAECGSGKGCYTKCSGGNCDFVISWAEGTSNDNVRITISGLVGGNQGQYLALGLSNDDEMSDDSVMYCVRDGAYNAYNNNGNKFSRTLTSPDDQAGLSNVQASLDNGVLTCSFLRSKTGGSNGQRFALDKAYTLFFATGSGGAMFVGKHDKIPVISTAAASLQDFTADVSGAAVDSVLVKTHGSLMVLAWIFAASLGIVFARYFKNVWEDSKWCGEKVWFQLHRTCMVFALLATASAFIIIFVDVGGYSHIHGEGYKKAHPIIGIIVTVLTVINPTLALFRPHPGTKNRPIFNWVHWGIGMVTYILGVMSIFFGMKMDRAGAPDYIIYILAAFVAWQFLIQVLLELAQCMGRNAGRSERYEMSDINGQGSSKPLQAQEPTFHKQLLVTLHVFVVSGFAIALIAILNVGSDE